MGFDSLLNKGVYRGPTIGVIKGDTRSSDEVSFGLRVLQGT